MAEEEVAQQRAIVTRAEAKAAGLKRYFTGVPCKNGHVAERFTNRSYCVACECGYRLRNKEKIRSSQSQYRAKNKDKLSAYFRRRYEAEKDAARVRMKDWYAKNKAIAVRRANEWNKANPESKRSSVRNRRARLRGLLGAHTRAQIEKMLQAQRRRCAACKCSISDGYHVDHIQPVARGGSNDITNIQLLCAPCNQSKGARDPIDWAQSLGRLL